MNSRISFCYDAGFRRTVNGYSQLYNAIHARPRGEGYAFYQIGNHKEIFLRWFKGDEPTVREKMDKYLREY